MIKLNLSMDDYLGWLGYTIIMRPSLWLLILIIGLPILSETVYTPALSDIAKDLAASESLVEFTLTIYLLGFALGTLFWGNLSDRWGRKACVLMGLGVYVLGCIGCYCSTSITVLIINRFIQALGGSTGTVLGQAIARDSFQGKEKGKIFATIGAALAFSPALGPPLGGILDQHFGWEAVFLCLAIIGALVNLISCLKLPETHRPPPNQKISLKAVAFQLFNDRRALGFGLVIAACQGMTYSYYAEAPFYLMNLLGLHPQTYGLTFISAAVMGSSGALLSRWLHNHMLSLAIAARGMLIILISISSYAVMSWIFGQYAAPALTYIVLCITCMSLATLGIGMTIGNCIALALEDYQHAIGTASSLLNCFTYVMIAFFTLGMSVLHNETLWPMPFYFLSIAIFIILVYCLMIREKPYQRLRVD